jgi:hypothetical protein
MSTKRIDSELELHNFITQLQIAGIEIPHNVTLEIDSPIFESELKKLAQTWIPVQILPIKRFKYRGEKITFKSE